MNTIFSLTWWEILIEQLIVSLENLQNKWGKVEPKIFPVDKNDKYAVLQYGHCRSQLNFMLKTRTKILCIRIR